MKSRLLKILCFVASPIVFPALAAAADHPKLAELEKAGAVALLQAADDAMTQWKDQTLKVKMTTSGAGDAEHSISMTIFSKGASLRALRYDEPADVRGMGVVIKGSDEIYVRLPDNENVRRVASHARKQGMQGTDYAFDDTVLTRLGGEFDPTITGHDDKTVQMTLKRKPDSKVGYSRLDIKIDREHLTIPFLQSYDDDGSVLKVEERSELSSQPAGNKVYKLIWVKSMKKDHKTRIDVLDEAVNTNLSDDMFSKRWLARGK